MGNERTGYNVPFAPALAIMAAIMVEETASPIFPITNAKMNREKFLITNDSKNAAYNKAITVFMQKTRIILNNNLPEKTVEGAAIN